MSGCWFQVAHLENMSQNGIFFKFSGFRFFSGLQRYWSTCCPCSCTQLSSSLPNLYRGVKITNIWNHHLDLLCPIYGRNGYRTSQQPTKERPISCSDAGSLEFLLEKLPKNHWTLPKREVWMCFFRVLGSPKFWDPMILRGWVIAKLPVNLVTFYRTCPLLSYLKRLTSSVRKKSFSNMFFVWHMVWGIKF